MSGNFRVPRGEANQQTEAREGRSRAKTRQSEIVSERQSERERERKRERAWSL